MGPTSEMEWFHMENFHHKSMDGVVLLAHGVATFFQNWLLLNEVQWFVITARDKEIIEL